MKIEDTEINTITNVRAVTGSTITDPVDIFVKDGKIEGIHKAGVLRSNGNTYNGRGKLALPGLIDLHFHPGIGSSEVVPKIMASEGKAALAGGFTYLRGHLLLGKDAENGYLPVIDSIIVDSEKVSPVDFSFNPQIGTVKQVNELPQLVKKGIRGFKIFYDAYQGEEGRILGLSSDNNIKNVLLRSLQFAGDHPEVRLIVHAEDGNIPGIAAERNKSEPNLLKKFSLSRPPLSEILKIQEVSQFSKYFGANIHIAHVSSEEALDCVLNEKISNPGLSFETEPHYLLLDYENNQSLGIYGKVIPPLRSPSDRSAMVRAISKRQVDSISTDTNPFTKSIKNMGESVFGDIEKVSPGFDFIQLALPLMFTKIVNKGHFSINDMVWATSENPSRVFNVKNKGKIYPGKDADIVILDPREERKISEDDLVDVGGKEWSPFIGERLSGVPETVFLRGEISTMGKFSNPQMHGLSI